MNDKINKRLITYQRETSLLGKQLQIAHNKAIKVIHKKGTDDAKKLAQLELILKGMGTVTLIIQNYLIQHMEKNIS